MTHFSSISVTRFVLVSTLINLVLYHLPLIKFSLKQFEAVTVNSILTLLTLGVLIVMITSSILFALSLLSPVIMKIVSTILVLINSVALYFMVTFQVILDRTMIGNILNTQTSESSSYFHLSLLVYLFFLGIVPSYLIWKTRLKPIKRLKVVLHGFIIIVFGVVWIYLNSSTWLWLDKHGKSLGGQIMPWSYVFNTVRHQNRVNKLNQKQTLLPDISNDEKRKTVVMLIIGEAARNQNFSLYGYERETNPLLSSNNIITMNKPSSCSTYTTESIACMLSHDLQETSGYEPLPSYLKRHGVEVIWHTRNWGEPRIETDSYEKRGELKKKCSGEKCGYDEVLLSGLKEKIASSQNDKLFVVLHMKGSHGPSYFSQYPKSFEKFTPVCQSVKLSECSAEELINAYDNTILYTDHVINQSIEMLKEFDKPSTMIYMSDHGESLGEYGLYLHGTPMSLAPKVQTDVPFLVWMSESFADQNQLNPLDFKQNQSHGHDNIFHSILGAFGMSSEIYQAEKDIFKSARH